MHFVFFGAEEVGIHGSAHYLDQMTAQGKKIAAAFIMDMIGYSGKHFGVTVEFSNKNGFVSKSIIKVSLLLQWNEQITDFSEFVVIN